MKKYTALQHGTFSALAVNRKLIALWETIEELQAEISELKGNGIPEPVAATEQETETFDSAIITEVVGTTEEDFNWRTTEDSAKLKQFALDELNLEIKGNKKASTIRTEIESFLESSEG